MIARPPRSRHRPLQHDQRRLSLCNLMVEPSRAPVAKALLTPLGGAFARQEARSRTRGETTCRPERSWLPSPSRYPVRPLLIARNPRPAPRIFRYSRHLSARSSRRMNSLPMPSPTMAGHPQDRQRRLGLGKVISPQGNRNRRTLINPNTPHQSRPKRSARNALPSPAVCCY
jgi:hypothetical protein